MGIQVGLKIDQAFFILELTRLASVSTKEVRKMKILLVCGAGASSGFMAQSMRKAAKKRGL